MLVWLPRLERLPLRRRWRRDRVVVVGAAACAGVAVAGDVGLPWGAVVSPERVVTICGDWGLACEQAEHVPCYSTRFWGPCRF